MFPKEFLSGHLNKTTLITALSYLALVYAALGYFRDKTVWGQGLHLPMTITFFMSLLLVFLFGRRAVCSWNCPCVGSRDTMGNAFRKKPIKTRILPGNLDI